MQTFEKLKKRKSAVNEKFHITELKQNSVLNS